MPVTTAITTDPSAASSPPGAAARPASSRSARWWANLRRWGLPASVLLGLVAGTLFWGLGWSGAAKVAWAATTTVALLPLSVSVGRDLWHRKIGVDLIALLSMSFALVLGEYAPGAVIALMLSGGQALEDLASGRARRELRALLARSPSAVHRYEPLAGAVAGQPAFHLTDPPSETVVPGDLLLVKPGEIVPVDGRVESGPSATDVAVLDESIVTGEPGPVNRPLEDFVRSGVLNAGGPFDLRAVATIGDSTYSRLVRLAEEAQRSKAPFVRLADRWALLFLVVTVSLAAAAWWMAGDARRALAVLVVATPCPMILAAPVAIVSGMSRAAGRGALIKNGAALEALARTRTVLLDKTGTLTTGTPELERVETFAAAAAGAEPGQDGDEILRLAASLDQVSAHVLAAAVVRAARQRHLALSLPTGTAERLGQGIAGDVAVPQDAKTAGGGTPGARHRVAIGRLEWLLSPEVAATASPAALEAKGRWAAEAATGVFVAVDGRVAGGVVLRDHLRPDAAATVADLRRQGAQRVILVTGDRLEPARRIAAEVGVDEVLAEQRPEQKVEAVIAARSTTAAPGTVMMIGDGVNDAPALAVADVGVALGARGSTASAEAADVVITLDRLERVAEAMSIARRTRRIAVEAVAAGMGLSMIAMAVAALGYLGPLRGALLQEAIDVAVILWALRAAR